MLASIIVPVYNRENFIKACLDSILNQTMEDYEIIVIDDGSTDGTRKVLEGITDAKVKILYNPTNKGLSYSRNRGVREAKGELVAFIDSDCIADERWLENLTKPFSWDPSIMMVGGNTVDPAPSNYWELVNKGKDFIASVSGYTKKVIGCNMASRRFFLIKNKFDEDLSRAADDLDIAIRCRRKGYKIYFTAAALITHYQRSTFYATVRQQFFYGHQNAQARIKNRKFPHISYGAWIILGAILSLINFHLNLLFLLIIIYVIIVALQRRTAILKERIITVPGRLISYLSNSLGNICFLFHFLSWPLLRLFRRSYQKPVLS